MLRISGQQTIRPFVVVVLMVALAVSAGAQVTNTDNFSTPVNYLTDGIVGTIWDGVYFGAGEFANSGTGGGGLGGTIQCDAGITSSNTLTLSTTGTAWEGTDDDGFFLYKVVKGDFSAVAHVVSPYDNTSYNTAGLQARAFSTGGNPLGGSEDYVSWTRFDEFSFANYLRSEVNGAATQMNPGGYPNSAYWLRMDRIGNIFRFYQRTNLSDSWQSVSFPAPVSGTDLTRADLAGQPLQVGIMHATFNNQIRVQFTDFSIAATNFGSFAVAPPPATSLVVTHGTNNAGISWIPDAASSGSLVLLAAGNGPIKQMPVNGFTYAGNATYGLGDLLLATNYFVVYSGTGTNVTVTNLPAGTFFTAAVFDYAGLGSAISYSRAPATASFSTPSPPPPSNTNVVVDPPTPALMNYVTLGDWNTNGNLESWTTAQISGAGVSNNMISGTASSSDPQLLLPNIANGPDLDLAYFDYLEIRMQVPANFTGSIPLYYGVTNTPGINTTSLRALVIGNAGIPQDGGFHVYRLFVGPQVFWRGNLTDIRLDPLGTAATVGQTFAIDYIRVGDLPGDVYLPRYSVNNPAPGNNDTANNQPVMDMQSKHFRVIWDNWDVTNFPTFWKASMPHGTLRNLEECWKTHIWKLGYTEPSQSWTPANRNGNKYKINLTMFYGGYFSGGDAGDFGWVNITPDGLRIDPPTLVPPHEFTHVCQMHQNPNGAQNVDGQFWEHHANYVRERWIYYYGPNLPGWTDAQSNLDPNYSYLSHLWIGHGRDYYLCWPWFLYLDENPDGLQDLGEGFVPKIWKTEPAGEYVWTTISHLTTHNTVQDIIGYMARRNVKWDYSHRSALQAAENSGDAEILQRWAYGELRQRPDDPTWWQVPMEFAPQQTGYKIHQLIPQGTGAGRVVTVNFHGLPYTNGVRSADWRASLVVVSDSSAVRYSSLWNAGSNSVTLAANENTLYLSVAGTPNQFLSESIDDLAQPYQSAPSKVRFPYELQVFGATPEESTNSIAGLVQLPLAQGGGWRSSSATVDSTAFVGPNARVLGSARVRGNAKILDYAVVEGTAVVSNNAVVSGHAIVRNSAMVLDNAKVRDYAMIIDNSVVKGNARILEHGQLTAGSVAQDWATVKGSCSTWHDNSVTTGPQAWNDAVLDGDFSTAQSVSNGFQFGFEEYNPGPLQWINSRTAPRRVYADYEFTAAHNSLAKDFYGVTDGYLQGGPAWTSSDGKRSGFLNFNGSTQYVILDKSLSDLKEISVTVWVKWAGGASNQPVWYFGSATNKCMFFTPDDGTGHAKFVIRINSTDQTLIAPAALTTGAWTQVTVTLSNNATGRLYVNGVLQQEGSITLTPDQLNAGNTNTAAQHNYLARGADSSEPFFNGAVDSFRIYTGALTNGEIAALQVANVAPTLTAISNHVTSAGITLVVTNSATDADQPWQRLTYSLISAPAGASITTNTGVFTWRPSVAQANTTNPVSVKVTDNGTPNLSATQNFFVIVNPLNPPMLNAVSLIGGQFYLQVSGDFGPDYTIQASTNLADWSALFMTNSPTLPFSWNDSDFTSWPARFYRVLLAP